MQASCGGGGHFMPLHAVLHKLYAPQNTQRTMASAASLCKASTWHSKKGGGARQKRGRGSAGRPLAYLARSSEFAVWLRQTLVLSRRSCCVLTLQQQCQPGVRVAVSNSRAGRQARMMRPLQCLLCASVPT